MGCATRLVLFGVIFLGVAAFFGFFEAQYMMSGKTTTGTVESVQAEQRRGRRGRRYNVDVCHFTYSDESGEKSGKCDLKGGVSVQAGQQVDIEYVPGSDTARIKGVSDMGMVGTFAGLGVIGLIVGLIMMRGGESTA